jgi:hypothetical protein
MGAVIDFDAHRRRRGRGPAPAQRSSAAQISCSHCGEPHPIIKLPGGEQRCVTAFFDGAKWFCRNRGCRRAWLNGGDTPSGST